MNKCVFSLQEGDADTLDRTAGAIRGRSARVCNVVSAEMDNYEPGPYTDRVMEAVVLLRNQGKVLHTVTIYWFLALDETFFSFFFHPKNAVIDLIIP